MKTALTAVLLCLAPAAVNAADLGQQCAAAREAGDTAEVNRIVAELITFRHVLSEVGIQAGKTCIEATLAAEYEFSRQLGRFQSMNLQRRAEEDRAGDLKRRERLEEGRIRAKEFAEKKKDNSCFGKASERTKAEVRARRNRSHRGGA